VERIRILLKSDKKSGTFTWRPVYVHSVEQKSIGLKFSTVHLQYMSHYTLLNSCQNEKWLRQICRENQSMPFIFYKFFPPKIVSFRATDIHSEYVARIAFLQRQRLRWWPSLFSKRTLPALFQIIRDLPLGFAIFSTRSYYNISFRAYLCTWFIVKHRRQQKNPNITDRLICLSIR